MTSIIRALLCLIATSVMTFPAVSAPEDLGPFESDEHTLLLAHYDDTIDADFASDDPRAEGRAPFVDGLFGRAIDATRGWMTPEISVADIENYPFFVPLTYTPDNVSPQSGCLEMFVRFEDVSNPEYFRRVMTWESGVYYGTGYVILALRPAEERTLQLLVKNPDGGETTLTAPFPYEWDEEWHHVGFQWNAETYGLIIDGEVAAEKPAVADGMPAPDTRIAIGAHNRGVNPAQGLIDELRISDIPRY